MKTSWRLWCYFEAQVWQRIVTLSLLSFSLFFFFFFFLFLSLCPESRPDLWGNHSLHHPFLTWDNALIMMIITLLFTHNSVLQLDTRIKIWLYVNASSGVPGYAMNQERHVWKNYKGGFATNTMSTTWSCKAIWQWWSVHNKQNGGKLHGNIFWNGHGNAIIGRYGGCFEEDIRRFMCDRAYRITGFGCTDEVCTNSQGEKGQCTVP